MRVRLSARAGKPSRWKETVAADVILFDNGFRQTYTIMHNNAMPAGVLRPADEVEAADPQGAPAKSGVVEGAMGKSRFLFSPVLAATLIFDSQSRPQSLVRHSDLQLPSRQNPAPCLSGVRPCAGDVRWVSVQRRQNASCRAASLLLNSLLLAAAWLLRAQTASDR